MLRLHPAHPKRALVVADGDLPSLEALPVGALDGADSGELLVVAADGGLTKAEGVGLRPRLVVGDGDSLSPEVLERLERQGVEVRLFPREKDASDTELAVRAAVERGASDVLIIGALGGRRFDHALANVLLLAAADIAASLTLVDRGVTVRVLGRQGPEKREVDGAAGDLLTLLPLSEEVRGVTLTGLAYPLAGATLRLGSTLGLSNVLVGRRATVSVESGRLAVVHAPREAAE